MVLTCRSDDAPRGTAVAGWLAQVRGAAGVEEIRLGPLSGGGGGPGRGNRPRLRAMSGARRSADRRTLMRNRDSAERRPGNRSPGYLVVVPATDLRVWMASLWLRAYSSISITGKIWLLK